MFERGYINIHVTTLSPVHSFDFFHNQNKRLTNLSRPLKRPAWLYAATNTFKIYLNNSEIASTLRRGFTRSCERKKARARLLPDVISGYRLDSVFHTGWRVYSRSLVDFNFQDSHARSLVRGSLLGRLSSRSFPETPIWQIERETAPAPRMCPYFWKCKRK